MKLRQRTVYLRKLRDQVHSPLFGQVCNDLQKSIGESMGTKRAREALRGWPNIAWQGEESTLTVSPWESVRDPDLQLLDVELVQRKGDGTWTVSIQVGTQHPDEIVIQEICRLSPDVSQLPLDDIPDVLGFLTDYACMDEDGYYAGRVYQVAWRRIDRFGDVVRSARSARKLPIVMISHNNDTRQPLLDPTKLAERLFGLAHVMRLDANYRWSARNLGLRHPCFDGAVRIYSPGYRDDDPASVHRYWRPDRIAGSDPEELYADIVRYVLEKSWSREVENGVLVSLAKEREEEAIRRQVQKQVDAVRQRLKREQSAQTEAEIEALFSDLAKDYEELASQYDRASEEIERLQNGIKARDDEIRLLQYRLNQKWESDAPPPQQPEAATELLLAVGARAVYNGLDQGERNAVDNQLLRKLLDENLRQRQTDAIAAQGGTCYVYPRGRSAGGRRVIYWMDGTQIKVCELFMHHDAYEDARNRGFDLSDYTDFVVWQPSDLNVVKEEAALYREYTSFHHDADW